MSVFIDTNILLRAVQPLHSIGRGREFTPSANLREEQREAVATVLGCRDFAVNLQGPYGTGKTATLRELGRGLREARRPVLTPGKDLC
jgi:Cdc6-like AAA superfamily ATPase